jgi:hypothetical protein
LINLALQGQHGVERNGRENRRNLCIPSNGSRLRRHLKNGARSTGIFRTPFNRRAWHRRFVVHTHLRNSFRNVMHAGGELINHEEPGKFCLLMENLSPQ